METFAPAPVERCGAGVSCKRPADYGSPTTVEMTLDATNCRGDQLKGLKRLSFGLQELQKIVKKVNPKSDQIEESLRDSRAWRG